MHLHPSATGFGAIASMCEKQVLQREREIADLEAMHKAVTAQLEQRLAHVEARLAKEADKCRHLEHR